MRSMTLCPAWTVTRWAIATLALAAVAVAADARGGEEKAVGEANARFYAALNVMFSGDLAPMKAVWSQRDDVTYMGPDGGFEVGWAPVLAVWEKQAARKLGGKIEATRVHVNAGTDLAVVSAVEVGENSNADGGPAKVSIRATNVFRKEDGTWKMIGHHTDLLPFLQPAAASGAQ